MVKATSTQQQCPHPNECPHGPKSEGYTCGMAFKVFLEDPAVNPDAKFNLVCTYCWQHTMAYQAFLASRQQQRGGGIVVAQQAPPPPLSGPGNNGRRG